MSRRTRALAVPALALVLAGTVAATASAAAPDRKPPRIVSAAMRDTDGDARTDRIRITYSERVRHAADVDGRYPFRIPGYPVQSVGRSGGRAVVVTVAEADAADGTAKPPVRYRRVRSGPVRDRAGRQAIKQTFRATRPHGHRPTITTTPPTPTDRDGDGSPNDQDCRPDDPAINPRAIDRPDLGLVDSNCDGIDGTERDAIFASPQGKDTNPGTRLAPKREIDAAVVTAAASGKDVLAAAGSYGRVRAATNVSVYGGYDPGTWARRLTLVTSIIGSPEGIYAEKATGVVLQLLTVNGVGSLIRAPGMSFYGIRAVGGSRLTLQRVQATAASGREGAAGVAGAAGVGGQVGENGRDGQCDGSKPGAGGAGGQGQDGHRGGDGGTGGHDTGGITGTGKAGLPGHPLSLGGPGGPAGDPGRDGANGTPGADGQDGAGGLGGKMTPGTAVASWLGQSGRDGAAGTTGRSGGGGGGGGGQVCTFCNNGSGNGGGGGGGAGSGAGGGTAGGPGGGSFGLYLHDSSATVSDSSTLTAGNGGAGGAGGAGGFRGTGAPGGTGSKYCKSEVGEGGDGGHGGNGGHGGGAGGGSGGPSVGVFKAGTSRATVSANSLVRKGAPGAGGAGGSSSANAGAAGEPGIAQAVFPGP